MREPDSVWESEVSVYVCDWIITNPSRRSSGEEEREENTERKIDESTLRE